MSRRALSARWPKFGFARFLIAILAVAGFLFLAGARLCYAGNGNGNGTDITKVEEEWELDLNTPSSADGAPQLTCLMSASGSTSGVYSVFQINQRTEPDGRVGGLQLQLWNGGSLLAVGNFDNPSALATAGEKIQWTHRLSVSNNGTVTDEIVGLSSSTWGNYGNNTTVLSASSHTGLNDLNSYDPNVTTANSGVDFGNARVGKLILRKVRIYTGNQHSVEQALDRVVFQY